MKQIDFTQQGGMPLTQDLLDFMQQGNKEAIDTIVAICGNNTILSGMEISNGVISDGLCIMNFKLLPFLGGSLPPLKWGIVEAADSGSLNFFDGTSKTVITDTRATFVEGQGIDINLFTRLSDLKTLKSNLTAHINNYGRLTEAINRRWEVESNSGNLTADLSYRLKLTKKAGSIIHVEGLLRTTTENGTTSVWNIPVGQDFNYQFKGETHIVPCIVEKQMTSSDVDTRSPAFRNLSVLANNGDNIVLSLAYFSVEQYPQSWYAINAYVNCDFEVN